MSRGIIYVMETVVPGLVKIGKTGTDNFDSRMNNLERNGYNNITGLKRRFAIAVNDYDEKETLLHSLFDRSRLQNSELFALDLELVIQLLSSFEGDQIYPKNETKEDSFKNATEDLKDGAERLKIPDGVYYLNEKAKNFGNITAKMRVENGQFIVEKGSVCRPSTAKWVPAALREAPIQNNILLEDVSCNSPSTAAWIPTGRSNNGWLVWKDDAGNPINKFREKTI